MQIFGDIINENFARNRNIIAILSELNVRLFGAKLEENRMKSLKNVDDSGDFTGINLNKILFRFETLLSR